jgi:hypothetical protein
MCADSIDFQCATHGEDEHENADGSFATLSRSFANLAPTAGSLLRTRRCTARIRWISLNI